MKKTILMLVILFGLFTFTGCPDYSHLRDAPDYNNMTDGGDEFESAEKDK